MVGLEMRLEHGVEHTIFEPTNAFSGLPTCFEGVSKA
jgi:hypothetical protein